LDGCCCSYRRYPQRAFSARACLDPAFDVGDPGRALKGTSECSPLDRQSQARFAGVQPCTPASHPASFIDQDSGRTAGISHEPEKLRPRTLLTASDAGTLRLILAVKHFCHGEHLPDVPSCLPMAARYSELQGGTQGRTDTGR
jgi:hypothetical protein